MKPDETPLQRWQPRRVEGDDVYVGPGCARGVGWGFVGVMVELLVVSPLLARRA